ncbi:RNA polymerase subunit sigma-70 [Dactylosporangium salmoneum]|uniref:RNA polymerase sigma factor n=1 Tax=Dactylosporangium salmoneum TaxID=53361 RepID=A0ABP5V9S5_9ACTN
MTTSVPTGFESRTAPLRAELLAHCYRMLGSFQDAEDLVQETLLRAWRAYDRFDERRASLRTWLHRIATNACLNALEGKRRRPLPSGLGEPGDDPRSPFVSDRDVPWLQPFPDARLGDPAAVVQARGDLRLALIAALQLLPPRQRAILILREVLEWPAAEVAAVLDTTPAAVNSGLQRARARLESAGLGPERVSEPDSAAQRALVDRYVEAFVAADLAALAGLLTEDAVLEMPPLRNWYRGRDRYAGFIALVHELRGRDWRMLPVGANGQPAVAAYVRAGDGYEPHSVQVFTVTPAGIAHAIAFVDPAVFVAFALPSRLR